jgi:enterochelin esterase-like enzyme
MDQVNFWSRIRICPPGQELLPTALPFVKRRKEARVLEPQSNVLFFLLIVIFIALAWWMVATRHLLFRLLAGCLAFLPAMTFGVMAVNKYYGYYPTWSAAWADITNQGVNAPSRLPQTTLAAGRRRAANQDQGSATLNGLQQSGYTLRLNVTGPRSHITRVVYVYLPPQYFQAAYSRYRFPVIELLHGQPGEPQDWINVVGVTTTLDELMARKQAQPAVLVMPDANGGRRISLQCLNQVRGPQDLTYLGLDLPARITHLFRVQPPGPAWGVAGYSEGGFCAANMALRLRGRYGFAGVLSGYFRPASNQLGHPARPVSPFGRDLALREQNTPLTALRKLPAGALIPQFWLGAGAGNAQDVAAAELFWRELSPRQPDAPLVLTPGGGHDMITWRAEIPLMLRWMTPRLARAAQREAGPSRRLALAARRPAGKQPA